ncbi:hypothetical protein CNMCM6106_007773 [Aspergillus hiratsukae]|uniref:Uncharacterized protein n=1 Tax=Aspergillus hiratsukae TaxID=1194566 RepID=A0A8H6UMY3_9EURO|nr:hypothetical protein CNMCM6106_007773 [Aspergillus hiratsukae]
MTSFSQSSTVTPVPQDSAWPPAHIWETMSAADRATWLQQIQRDRTRRLEMDEAEVDLCRRRPRADLRVDEDNQEENLIGFKKAASSLKDWGPNPQIWTNCFLTYLAVIGYLFGDKHPKAVPNLLMFMRQILDVAQTYQWPEAVLPLALNFHQYILDKGELSTDSYLVTAQFREKYLRHNLTLPAKSPPQPQQPDLAIQGLPEPRTMIQRFAISSTRRGASGTAARGAVNVPYAG